LWHCAFWWSCSTVFCGIEQNPGGSNILKGWSRWCANRQELFEQNKLLRAELIKAKASSMLCAARVISSNLALEIVGLWNLPLIIFDTSSALLGPFDTCSGVLYVSLWFFMSILLHTVYGVYVYLSSCMFVLPGAFLQHLWFWFIFLSLFTSRSWVGGLRFVQQRLASCSLCMSENRSKVRLAGPNNWKRESLSFGFICNAILSSCCKYNSNIAIFMKYQRRMRCCRRWRVQTSLILFALKP
jgi:Zn-dependent protease with chaperone function